MKYEINIQMDGKERIFTVISDEAAVYKVYADAHYLGSIKPELHEDMGTVWTTKDEQLKDMCEQIGERIERADL